MNPKADAYFDKAEKWPKELEQLRMIILDSGLYEVLKWGCPCYCFNQANIVIIGELKEYCVLSFFKGALLGDVNGILHKPGDNTQAMRIARFTSVKQIVELAPVLKAYIYEAIEVEKEGLKVYHPWRDENNTEPVPAELQKKLDENPAFKNAFYALTPGRQRGYILYFAQPKQSVTRALRVEKYIQQILDGKGLHDDYLQRRK
jgi:uncharacterized protein YdeI (YjbR/CyaY-like superfamily)